MGIVFGRKAENYLGEEDMSSRWQGILCAYPYAYAHAYVYANVCVFLSASGEHGQSSAGATAYIEAGRDVQGRESVEVRRKRGKPRVENKDPEARQRSPEAPTAD